ncbi:MAG TPA: CAP domain-containing protein [Acidimicrobiia bacterium]|nr:CAP domain-containing protein [Acidimicrobiia bacterium]
MKRLVLALITVAALTLGLGTRPAHAQAPTAAAEIEAQFVEAINGLRLQQGVASLTWDETLAAKARSWSTVMASEGGIRHSRLEDGIDVPWSRLGENVGMGGSVTSLHDAFVASPSHYENLIDPGFDALAIGVTVAADGTIYVAQEFMERPDAPVALGPEQPEGTTGVSLTTTAPAAPVVEGAVGQRAPEPSPASPPASGVRVRDAARPAATELAVASPGMTARLMVGFLGILTVGSVLTLVHRPRRASSSSSS